MIKLKLKDPFTVKEYMHNNETNYHVLSLTSAFNRIITLKEAGFRLWHIGRPCKFTDTLQEAVDICCESIKDQMKKGTLEEQCQRKTTLKQRRLKKKKGFTKKTMPIKAKKQSPEFTLDFYSVFKKTPPKNMPLMVVFASRDFPIFTHAEWDPVREQWRHSIKHSLISDNFTHFAILENNEQV